MRISDWSSDVCSSDLRLTDPRPSHRRIDHGTDARAGASDSARRPLAPCRRLGNSRWSGTQGLHARHSRTRPDGTPGGAARARVRDARSEEHTSELQSLMRISYAVFCLKKKTTKKTA